ncbi:putative membrane protein [Oribacterium sinus]|jgi:hypothetical protein|uniref:Putative membrane protein n=1 Tax=Oribacterium sinus TaxID=237576 RepID=A0A7W9W3F0_9FIRM|nr:hypothetical protein [Oribacterium sinus]MBB6041929.1 putative membrane protein [Oribacterium sinus]
MNRSVVLAIAINAKWLLPFLLLSFLFIVILTAVIYKIMWFRLEKIIKEKEKEKDGVEKIEEDSFKKEEKAVLSKMNEILQKEE